MKSLKIPILIISSLLLLLFLHTYGMTKNLYLSYRFYDIIVHFLGGICIGLSTFYIAEIFKINFIKSHPSLLIIITFIAGILWELFEIKYDIAGNPFGTYLYYLDTIKDLSNDILGSGFVWIFVYLKNKKTNQII